MEEIEILIKESNILIDKNIDGSIDFIEPMLKPLVGNIFNLPNEIIEKYSYEVKELFKRIICMSKSTGSWGFYYNLAYSNLSFSDELLVYGINNEPYYNNNDAVFICYMIVVSRKNGFEDILNLFFEKTKISLGHCDYDIALERCYLLKNNFNLLIPSIPDDTRDQIISIIKNSTFYNTRLKAICVALFFGIRDIVPVVVNRLNNKILSINEDTKEYLFEGIITEIRDLSISIYYLTNNIYYKKCHDLFCFDKNVYKRGFEYKEICFKFLEDISTLEKF